MLCRDTDTVGDADVSLAVATLPPPLIVRHHVSLPPARSIGTTNGIR